MTGNLQVAPLSANDWEAVRTIYQEGINTGQATFETNVPTWEAWDAAKRPDCRLAARRGRRVVGWSALNPVSTRAVYGGVAEVSIYIARAERGRGIGRLLLAELIKASETAGIWTLQASIFPENEASMRLFQSSGFRIVGRRERIARLFGAWRDTIILERRSSTVGE